MREDYLNLDNKSISKDKEFENILRPKSFKDFYGQDQIINNIKVFVKAAKKRSEPLDHVILHGPPGLGKTTLSNIISNELSTNLKVTSWILNNIYKIIPEVKNLKVKKKILIIGIAYKPNVNSERSLDTTNVELF